MKEIGVGLISVGWMGKLHAKSMQQIPIVFPELGVKPRLVIACDTAEDRAQYAVDSLGFEGYTTDYNEVLNNPGVDVVSICAPNFLHKEIAVAAAKAGKHFWIEKPVGRGADETEEVQKAAQEAGVVTSIGFNYRTAPAVAHARELIQSGKLGRITNVRGSFFADYSAEPNGALSWRFIRELAGSGVLGDLMGHLADLVHYVVGPIHSVSAITSTVYTERPKLPMGSGTHFAVIENGEMGDVENEDYGGMLVRFDDSGYGAGAVGTLEASRVSIGPRSGYNFEVYGTEGSLKWEFSRMNELELALGRKGDHVGYQTVYAGPGFGEFSSFQPGAGVVMGYDDLKTIEAKRFIEAVIGGKSTNSNINDALLANRVVSAAEKSAESGQWVEIEQVENTTSSIRGDT